MTAMFGHQKSCLLKQKAGGRCTLGLKEVGWQSYWNLVLNRAGGKTLTGVTMFLNLCYLLLLVKKIKLRFETGRIIITYRSIGKKG